MTGGNLALIFSLWSFFRHCVMRSGKTSGTGSVPETDRTHGIQYFENVSLYLLNFNPFWKGSRSKNTSSEQKLWYSFCCWSWRSETRWYYMRNQVVIEKCISSRLQIYRRDGEGKQLFPDPSPRLLNTKKSRVGVLFCTLILVKILWIWNNQCGQNKHVPGSFAAACDLLYGFSNFALHLFSEAEPACCIYFFFYNCLRKHCKNLKITSLESYLPPPKGLFREDAVLSGHQRVGGLIEAFREPWVSFEICNTLPTSTRPFGEKAVWKLKCLFENIERGVPESVTKQERCKSNATKKESKGPDFSTFDYRHVVSSRNQLVWDLEGEANRYSSTILQSQGCEIKTAHMVLWCPYSSDSWGLSAKNPLEQSHQWSFFEDESKSSKCIFPLPFRQREVYWSRFNAPLRCRLCKVNVLCVTHAWWST